MHAPQVDIKDQIPEKISESLVLDLLKNGEVDYRHILYLKSEANLSDEDLSSWFDISVKTFRNYKKRGTEFNDKLKEHLILLVSLYRHGKDVFGSMTLFTEWLQKQNFFFDDEKPFSLLKTITGIRFTEDRLTAIEYGDNI